METLVYLLFVNGRLRGAYTTYAAACAKGASWIEPHVKITVLATVLDEK